MAPVYLVIVTSVAELRVISVSMGYVNVTLPRGVEFCGYMLLKHKTRVSLFLLGVVSYGLV